MNDCTKKSHKLRWCLLVKIYHIWFYKKKERKRLKSAIQYAETENSFVAKKKKKEKQNVHVYKKNPNLQKKKLGTSLLTKRGEKWWRVAAALKRSPAQRDPLIRSQNAS